VDQKFAEIEKSISSAVSTLTKSSSTKIDAVTQKINSNTTSINIVVDSVKSLSPEVMTKSFAEVLKGDSEGTSVKGVFKEVINEQRKEQIKEDGAKEERQKNVIIYIIGEEQGLDRDERYSHDKNLVQNILSHLGLEEIEPKAIIRLGRFDPQKHTDGKIRPIKVLLHTKESRDSIMRNLYKLNHVDNELKKAQIGYDLSEDEREVVKGKVDEAKTLSEGSAEFFYRVRGPPWALWLKKEKRRVENIPHVTP
jgi:hypothetical protein